ncbi:hypothetical protein F0562_033848 [Nyssa sinensis]|uniref:Uncharacterized protein n=1 Tax=Nyssa sinensis TaxID=561372 RepID=A0A5J5AED6_9ASTE|nr:hypothetical protein F0562_033848 [Nyssa sinensis]
MSLLSPGVVNASICQIIHLLFQRHFLERKAEKILSCDPNSLMNQSMEEHFDLLEEWGNERVSLSCQVDIPEGQPCIENYEYLNLPKSVCKKILLYML